ncbi:Rieske 2Fe-2S domain-containing protein [Nocardioides sp.]|uniref:Rieske (2Fe-2S) protein n=1 Tax=Nocardioides sp. TaxID=35761 RepID=UPI002633E3D7|nr:Rieske 2Fe-2S domain-containing protein [Nocardioides sp.]
MSRPLRIASLADLPPGGSLLVARALTGLDDDVALLREQDGTVHAVDDSCTHWIASLARGWVRDGCVVCPAHAATYDLRTGVELTTAHLPPVRVHRLAVCGDDIYLVQDKGAG